MPRMISSVVGSARSMAERGAAARLSIIVTSRPEFRSPWGLRSHHGTISLGRLIDRKCARWYRTTNHRGLF